MKAWILTLTLVLGLYAQSGCREQVARLVDLQKRLLSQSLQRLSPGAWARYEGGTAVYVGKEKREGTTLYGIDVTLKKVPAQGWFALTPKPFHTPQKTYRVPTLDPQTLYLRNGNNTMLFKKDQIKAAATLFGVDIGALFSPLPRLMPDQCARLPKITPVTYRLGKRVLKAYKITDDKGRYAVLSPEVPFGVVELYDGKKQGVFLRDFGQGGKRPAITPAMRQKAIYLPISIRLSAR
ncbi:MAG: hypothetical protein GXO33_01925 [Epsilonproteobacteria bacterium]|nr:hypothetical protein [Campylobacterota bacterium]